MDNIKVFALGGLDESGRDCYIVEINDDIFVLDCGTSLPDKTIPGVDYLLPNFQYLVDNKDKIKAYLISHGHDENMGALQYFYNKAPAPIYCTSSTRIYMEANANYLGVKANFNFVEQNPSSSFIVAGHHIRFFQVPHNVSKSVGICIETDQGNIIYTSDFIVDYAVNDPNYIFDLKSLAEISEKDTLLLLADSKTANKKGYCSPLHKLVANTDRYFEEAESRIFISCFWQNEYRIDEICNLVNKYHKKIYFYNEFTAFVMNSIIRKISPDLLKEDKIVQKEDLLRVPEQDLVVLMLGLGADLYENIDNLAFERNLDKRLKLTKNDIFISAGIARPALETMQTHSIDNLYRTGCKVVWLTNKDIISMHPQEDDLKLFITLLKPKFYLPVRGNFVKLMANARLAISMNVGLNYNNVFILDNGMQLAFNGGNRPQLIPNEVNEINVAPTLVDGTGISRVGSEVVEERIRLGIDGVVIVASTVSLTKKKIVSGPDCQMRGFVYVKEAEPLLKSVTNIYVDEINNAFLSDEPFNAEQVKNNVKERSKRFIFRENGREPYILPVIILVD